MPATITEEHTELQSKYEIVVDNCSECPLLDDGFSCSLDDGPGNIYDDKDFDSINLVHKDCPLRKSGSVTIKINAV